MRARLRRPFYGWYIVGAAIGAQAIAAGLLMQAYGSYIVLLEREFHWSRTQLSGAFSLARVEDGLLGPLQGWLLDRFGPRAVMRVGIVVFAIGFFLFARLDSVVEFYVTFTIAAVGAALAGFLSITTAIVNWFDRRRSLAMGLALLGTAIGGLFLPLIVWGLENWGWRAIANISGVLVLVLGLPLTQVIRHHPEQYGYLPDGRSAEEAEADAVASRAAGAYEVADYTAREAMRTRAFWFISLAHSASVLVVSVAQVHFIPHVTESLGYSLTQAASLVTVMTVANLAGRPVGGFIGDRTSSRLVIIACMLMHAVALLLLTFASSLWMVMAFAILNGFAWGARVPVVVSMRAEYFGSKSFGSIMGFSSLVVTGGSVSGPVLAGLWYDSTGSYTAAFTVLALLAALGSLFLVFTPPPRGTRPKREPLAKPGPVEA